MKKADVSGREDLYLERDLANIPDKKVSAKDRKSLDKNRRMTRMLAAAEPHVVNGSAATLVNSDTWQQTLTEHGVKHMPQWRRLTPKNRALMYHLGLSCLSHQQGKTRVVPFTLNLTPKAITQAKTADSFSAWLQRRLSQNLHRALGRKVEFFFQVEVEIAGSGGRPHLHGELLLLDDEVRSKHAQQPLRTALHLINDYDANPAFKKHALLLNLKQADVGWPDYLSKHTHISSMYFNGKPLAHTRGCSQAARALWEELRVDPNNQLRKWREFSRRCAEDWAEYGYPQI